MCECFACVIQLHKQPTLFNMSRHVQYVLFSTIKAIMSLAGPSKAQAALRSLAGPLQFCAHRGRSKQDPISSEVPCSVLITPRWLTRGRSHARTAAGPMAHRGRSTMSYWRLHQLPWYVRYDESYLFSGMYWSTSSRLVCQLNMMPRSTSVIPYFSPLLLRQYVSSYVLLQCRIRFDDHFLAHTGPPLAPSSP